MKDLNLGPSKEYTIIRSYSDGGTTPGIYGNTFRLALDTNELEITDILKTSKSLLFLRVKDKYTDNDLNIYILTLVSNDPDLHVDWREINQGCILYRDYSFVSE